MGAFLPAFPSLPSLPFFPFTWDADEEGGEDQESCQVDRHYGLQSIYF